ncbi:MULTISPECIES: EthD family reductase [Vibrio]|uniref:EthD family reductase n=1 Tax=Vibrio TaxID=662 RepID=UPI000C8444C1|nr:MULTISPECIES: EthD family reductase [Vibrio]MBT9243000.1 EthD family reductase [Vibrio splendidus]MCR9351912.1 EthD family reductase [Vibrio alginolyticus]MCR9361099.1 EthD family reductase [Vibrio alginolyticus]MDP2615084.1 EthD family reductase [Vibrio splendidus]PMF50322.1 ethyl tert-butyl ether degradation protein EthD [Vibrio cyclitrophicus]
MIKAYVLYPNKDDVIFDFDYYCNKHVPMIGELLGEAVKGATVDAGVASVVPGEAAPYVAISTISFESLESFQTAFGPNAEKIKTDVPNFTNTAPTIQLCEQKI